MIHPLKDIDPDGVMPKKRERNNPIVETVYNNGEVKGYNQSRSDHKALGIKVDVGELAKMELKQPVFRTFEQKWYLGKENAQAIAQNPRIFKIVKVKV